MEVKYTLGRALKNVTLDMLVGWVVGWLLD